MNTIENELLDVINIESQKNHNSHQILDYEKATSFFKKLVEDGLVKERGYNLESIETAHLHRYCFNVK